MRQRRNCRSQCTWPEPHGKPHAAGTATTPVLQALIRKPRGCPFVHRRRRSSKSPPVCFPFWDQAVQPTIWVPEVARFWRFRRPPAGTFVSSQLNTIQTSLVLVVPPGCNHQTVTEGADGSRINFRALNESPTPGATHQTHQTHKTHKTRCPGSDDRSPISFLICAPRAPLRSLPPEPPRDPEHIPGHHMHLLLACSFVTSYSLR